MGTRMVRLTVLFEPPFWIGLCEREEDGQYAVRRIVFGAEPREQGKAARRVQTRAEREREQARQFQADEAERKAQGALTSLAPFEIRTGRCFPWS